MSASFKGSPPFPSAARLAIGNSQLRANLAHATTTIRMKRNRVIGELADFEELRRGAETVKNDALGRLDALLIELEARVEAAGGHVHYARDADEANAIVTRLVQATGAREVVKVKSMTTAEIGLNDALQAAGIDARETDLAELIVQLGNDLPSHIVVPAIHRNRAEIRETFIAEMGNHGAPAPEGLSDDPVELAGAARTHLREHFLRAKVAISGANFAVAESGSLVIVESEGNGRMCLTLADTLISVVGIDKVVPTFADLEIFLQLLPRSATGERMNPYTSIWTGPVAGDGPSDMHLVLLDNGRSDALADTVGRQALRCIRCAACLNVCPVYERVGGHAYGSVYPGPIGAVLAPQLKNVASDAVAASLPFASTLCGACFEVCPVRIDIPRLLVHLRGNVVDEKRKAGPGLESTAMAAAGYVLEDARRLAALERMSGRMRLIVRRKTIRHLPGPLAGWTAARDAPLPAAESFRTWWSRERGDLVTVPPMRPVVPKDGSSASAFVAALVPERWRKRSRSSAPSSGTATTGPTQSAARESILDAIGAALKSTGAAGEAVVVRDYVRAGQAKIEAPLDLLTERLEDYRATVWRVAADGLADAVAYALEASGARSVVAPSDVDGAWLDVARASGVEAISDSATLDAEGLDRIDAAVSGCALAIAETGTIVLDGGARQGRRVLSLVPDQLIVVVHSAQVVNGVPDAVAALNPIAPQTWISGPSATSDIELNRVEGVHGPRRLDVILVDDAVAS